MQFSNGLTKLVHPSQTLSKRLLDSNTRTGNETPTIPRPYRKLSTILPIISLTSPFYLLIISGSVKINLLVGESFVVVNNWVRLNDFICAKGENG